MQSDLHELYRVLEVEPGANLEEVKRAYRELVKVWHPDRFVSDPKLQRKANEKLKQINFAYKRICEAGPMPHSSASNSSTDFGTAGHSESPKQSYTPTAKPLKKTNLIRTLAQLAVTVVIMVVVRVVFSTNNSSSQRAVSPQPVDSTPLPIIDPSIPSFRTEAAGPRVPKSLGIAQNPGPPHQATSTKLPEREIPLRDIGINTQGKLPDHDLPPSINEPETSSLNIKSSSVTAIALSPVSAHAGENLSIGQLKRRAASSNDAEGSNDTGKLPARILNAETSLSSAGIPRDFFSVGSTRDEVLAVQGTPDKFTDAVFGYPYGSEVFFQNGRVTTWRVVGSPLRARLLPAEVVENRGFFTVGSTKDEVLVTQGTPDRFTDTVFGYPYGSEVFFQNGRVATWRVVGSPLKAKLLPKTAVENRGFFTVGSTKDEVLATQGTPDRFTDTVFGYPYGSEVFFQNGRVVTWRVVGSPLKAKLLSTTVVNDRGFFTVGSTKDEVLAVQGTPDRFTDTAFGYPYGSEVFFQNGLVTSWKVVGSPLKAKLQP